MYLARRTFMHLYWLIFYHAIIRKLMKTNKMESDIVLKVNPPINKHKITLVLMQYNPITIHINRKLMLPKIETIIYYCCQN